jgi:hypothetical protein
VGRARARGAARSGGPKVVADPQHTHYRGWEGSARMQSAPHQEVEQALRRSWARWGAVATEAVARHHRLGAPSAGPGVRWGQLLIAFGIARPFSPLTALIAQLWPAAAKRQRSCSVHYGDTAASSRAAAALDTDLEMIAGGCLRLAWIAQGRLIFAKRKPAP